MNPDAEFDIIVYGASGYTGRLVAEHLAKRYGADGDLKWALAGRSLEKLAKVRDEIGAPASSPLIAADSEDPASLEAMARRAKAIVTTVGPYQLYGANLVATCAATGTDYLDLSGETIWMHQMIAAHDAAAKASGARILFSSGFDSIPFELGVFYLQGLARAQFGRTVPRVKGRTRGMRGGLSGGTAASGRATMAALQKDPGLIAIAMDPFCLTPGFKGPPQPPGDKVEHDPDVGADVGPFIMAAINTRNVHRSNLLQGHAYGADFVYDEMSIIDPAQARPAEFSFANPPKPGEGPTKEERESGFYDILFIGIAPDGRQVRASVKGDMDPGYGSTAKMIAETAICLVRDAPEVAGGIWTPGAALGDRLVKRLQDHAGLTFTAE